MAPDFLNIIALSTPSKQSVSQGFRLVRWWLSLAELPGPPCGLLCLVELDPLDPWRIYGPQPEPRTLFVISDGHVSSPPLQVSQPE